MFTLVQVNGYSNKQECGFIIKYLCTAESKFFFLLENTEVFNPQSFLLLNPKFHSVKPSVSTCQSASFCQILNFFLSSRKFPPVKLESRLNVKSKVFSCQFVKLFLFNQKFPPVKLEVASFRIASFCQI